MNRIPLRVPILNGGKKPSELAHEQTARDAVAQIAKLQAVGDSFRRLLCECVRLAGGEVRINKPGASLFNLVLHIEDNAEDPSILILKVTEEKPEPKV